MSDYIGTRKQVDEYVGSRLVEAAYLGSRKYYDAYSEVSGSLPLVYESRVEHILKTYALYGSASGAGVETENLWDENYENISSSLTYKPMNVGSGSFTLSTNTPLGTGGSSLFLMPGQQSSGASTAMYGAYDGSPRTVSSVNGYVTLTYRVYDNKDPRDYQTMLTLGSTAPSEYIPFGYKIPLTNTGENSQSETYPLYIGSTKLGEEEYLDYESGKVYKLKEVHKDTVTINGIEWDILGYDHDTVYKSDNTLAQHSVTIQTHDCISELQFDAKEALFAFPNGLTAGAYKFTVGAQPWYASDVNKVITFTLTQAIPNNGVLVLTNGYNATMIGTSIKSYASLTATTEIEAVTLTEADAETVATDLGTVANAISQDGNTNSIQRALMGSNNWKQSALRQYLNSSAAAGSVWTPQTKFDRPPSWATTAAGFLHGIDPDFLAVVGTVKKRTALNKVCDGGGYVDTDDKIFLLSRTEVYGGNENSVAEGSVYDYFKNYSDLSQPGTGADSNRIKYLNSSAKYWWLRSPYSTYANYTRNVYSSGYIYGNGATGTYGLVPACCIVLDDINANPYLQSLFLKPIDPPVPLPAITAYKGNNTISSAETPGSIGVTGRINV